MAREEENERLARLTAVWMAVDPFARAHSSGELAHPAVFHEGALGSLDGPKAAL